MGRNIVSLASMQPGQKGWIAGLYLAEDIRQRLKAMGFIQGAEIECVYISPFGDPAAYFVRGTLIAVRKEDAEKIEIRTEKPIPEGREKGWG